MEPLLEPYLAWYRGQALFYAGEAGAAAAEFARAEKAGPAGLAERARARRGEALLAAGRAKEAVAVLEEAVKAEPSAELLSQRAEARRAVRDVAGERADLRTLAVRYGTHPYGEEALARLETLAPPTRLTLSEHLKRARLFLGAGQAKRALEELEKAEARKLVRQKQARADVALLRAQALYAAGRAPEADEALALASKGPPSVASEAALVAARRALRADDNAGARARMAALEKTWPKEAAGDEAGFFVGWLDLQGGRFAEAVKAFEAFEKRHERSRRRDEALWFRALAHVRMEQYGEAREVLERLVATYPRSSLVPQARYWSARSQELGGAAVEVTGPGYESVIAMAPNSYYALLASERLRALGREPRPAFPEAPRLMGEAPPPPELGLTVALTTAGLFRDAAEEVKARTARLHTSKEALTFTHALLRLGEYGHAYAVGARHLWGQAFGERVPEALAVFYPRAYASAVEDEAARQQVDPYLVWAIMRRESAFRPEVASAADARGLMQVIPKTARAIAEKLSEPAPEPADLFSPVRSIRYGAWYLAALTKRFTHPVLVAAAYNAGPRAAVRWAKEKGTLPLDLFVEEIPYKETRGYVKQVVADLFLYHAFYGSEAKAPKLSLTLPEPTSQGVSF